MSIKAHRFFTLLSIFTFEVSRTGAAVHGNSNRPFRVFMPKTSLRRLRHSGSKNWGQCRPAKHLDAVMLAYLIAPTPFFAYGATRRVNNKS
jgi:hypothetical protein